MKTQTPLMNSPRPHRLSVIGGETLTDKQLTPPAFTVKNKSGEPGFLFCCDRGRAKAGLAFCLNLSRVNAVGMEAAFLSAPGASGQLPVFAEK